jgi:hypothetical protein
MSIKKRVRTTPPTLVGDAEVEDQGHRTRNINQVGCELNVFTPLTPAPGHLLSLYLFCRGTEEILELLDSPIVSLLDSRVIPGSGDMVTGGVKDELLASAGRES